jgi:hypothetical protein
MAQTENKLERKIILKNGINVTIENVAGSV